MGSIGGFNKRLAGLPWASEDPHTPSDFDDVNGRRIVESISSFVVERGYTAVLAPTHYIESANSAWLDVDVRTTGYRRRYLDGAGAGNGPIFYSLAVSYEMFRTPAERYTILARLAGQAIECLWIKISQTGTLTHAGIRNLVNGAAEFHSLGLPIVGDMMGGLRGLSALAFWGGRRDLPRRNPEGKFQRRPVDEAPTSSQSGFSWPTRIYVPALDMNLLRKEARALFDGHGSKSRFGCRQRLCCPKGWKDMVVNPVRHSVVPRSQEIHRLSTVPEHVRAQHFLEETLRPATDSAVFAESLSFASETNLESRMREKRKALDRLRVGLGRFVQEYSVQSVSEKPLRRAQRS